MKSAKSISLLSMLVASIFATASSEYSYETENVMEAAETGVPSRGYHVYESEFYPESSGSGFGRGRGFRSSFGYDPSFISGQRFIGGLNRFGAPAVRNTETSYFPIARSPVHQHLPHHQHGGYLDKNTYNDEKKLLNGEVYEKVDGKKGEVQKHDEEGYVHGKVALKKDNADKGYYSEEDGAKKQIEDGNKYLENKHFDREEKNEDQKKYKKGHRKGHVTKGFKTTHHKDESGKTETFFDEASDESDDFSYDGKSGSAGEQAKHEAKGEHENGKFNAGQRRSQGHYDNEHVVDKGNLDKGEYGQKKYSSGGEVYGANKGIDEHSLLGQQEANRLYKHYPYGGYAGHAPHYVHY